MYAFAHSLNWNDAKKELLREEIDCVRLNCLTKEEVIAVNLELYELYKQGHRW